mmetsp:Transcript_2217/g.3505  ORF Transcript_2217/g.3505 Transcript_2217/m.3505 type:complete len:755 (+) Transcript_2217:30-2294(+)
MRNINTFIATTASVFATGVRSAPCTVCEDGSMTKTPDKIVNAPNMPKFTCGEADVLTPILYPDELSDSCQLIHQFNTVCGCPRKPNDCSLCLDGSSVDSGSLNTELSAFASLFSYEGKSGEPPNCEFIQSYLHSFSEDTDFCAVSQRAAAETCGCPWSEQESGNTSTTTDNIFDHGASPGGEGFAPPVMDFGTHSLTFFWAQTREEAAMLKLVYRIGCSFSIFASVLVILDNICNPKRMKSSTYNQIIALMAFFDILYGIAMILLEIPRPDDDLRNLPGEKGNMQSCLAQGWFMQLGGTTSLFLNAALSTYYVLVVGRQQTTGKSPLTKYKKYLIGLPLLAGVIIASASIPFITTTWNGCQVSPPNPTLSQLDVVESFSSSWAPFLALYAVPALLVLIYTTVTLIFVYYKVRSIGKSMNEPMPSTSEVTRPYSVSIDDRTAASTANNIKREPSATSSDEESESDNLEPNIAIEKSQSSSGKRMKKLRRTLFIQSFLYLLTLCVTWSITLWASISVHVNKRLGVNIWIFLAMFLMPLQGFMNAVIFFTPKISSWVEKRWKKLKLCCCSTTNTMHTADAHTSVLAQIPRERRPRKKTVSFHDNPPIAGHIINQQLQGEGGLIQVGSRQQYSDQTDQELGEASFIIAPKRTWRIWNPVQSSRIESRRGASSFVEEEPRRSLKFLEFKGISSGVAGRTRSMLIQGSPEESLESSKPSRGCRFFGFRRDAVYCGKEAKFGIQVGGSRCGIIRRRTKPRP